MGCGLANKKIKICSITKETTYGSRILSKRIQKSRKSYSNSILPNQTKKDVYSEYKIIDKISSGTFGKVYKVEELKTGIIRAMKIINKNEILNEKEDRSKSNNRQNSEQNEFLDEIKILKSLDHPNIIKMIKYFVDSRFIYIILEYFPHGDLLDEISNWKIYSQETACQIIYQILIGLNYLHTSYVVHRDLKPENIILLKNEKSKRVNSIHHDHFSNNKNLLYKNEDYTSNQFLKNMDIHLKNEDKKSCNDQIPNDENSISKNIYLDNCNNNGSSINNNKINYDENLANLDKNPINSNASVSVKIIDFGSGKIFERKILLTSINGTLYYMAPEMINANYNEKVDIWSCGVIFYVMLVGYLPFIGKTVIEIVDAIKGGKYEMNNKDWQKISTDVKHLLRCMLTYCPKNRISAFGALNHSVFSKIQRNFNFNNEGKILKKTLENLRRVNVIKKLREETFSYLVHYYTNNKEIAKLNSAFIDIDKNKDGKICFDDLKEKCDIIFEENLSVIEIRGLLDHIDYDKNGFIEYSEFIKTFLDTKFLTDEIKLKNAFDSFDLNKDGKLSIDEIISIFSDDYDNIFLKNMNANENNNKETLGIKINYEFMNSPTRKILKNEGIDFLQFKEIMLRYLEKNESAEEDVFIKACNCKIFLKDSAYVPTYSIDIKYENNLSCNDRKNTITSKNNTNRRSNLKIKNLNKKPTRSKSDESTQLIPRNITVCTIKNSKENSNDSVSLLTNAIESKKDEITSLIKNEYNCEGLFIKNLDNVIIKNIQNYNFQHQLTKNSGFRKVRSCINIMDYKKFDLFLEQKDFEFVNNINSKKVEIVHNLIEFSNEN